MNNTKQTKCETITPLNYIMRAPSGTVTTINHYYKPGKERNSIPLRHTVTVPSGTVTTINHYYKPGKERNSIPLRHTVTAPSGTVTTINHYYTFEAYCDSSWNCYYYKSLLYI